MDVFTGEQLDHLVNNVLDKLQRLIFTHAEDIVGHAPLAPYLIRTTGTSQLGIGRQCAQHVARHVNLGDDSNITVGSIAHDILDLLLSVVATIGHAVVHGRVVAQHRSLAPSAHLGQTGIFFDFHSPALVIGQMPVQAIHTMQRHDVDKTLHRLDGKEVAHAVQVHATVGEAR